MKRFLLLMLLAIIFVSSFATAKTLLVVELKDPSGNPIPDTDVFIMKRMWNFEHTSWKWETYMKIKTNNEGKAVTTLPEGFYKILVITEYGQKVAFLNATKYQDTANIVLSYETENNTEVEHLVHLYFISIILGGITTLLAFGLIRLYSKKEDYPITYTVLGFLLFLHISLLIIGVLMCFVEHEFIFAIMSLPFIVYIILTSLLMREQKKILDEEETKKEGEKND